jgi:hypothetical protein
MQHVFEQLHVLSAHPAQLITQPLAMAVYASDCVLKRCAELSMQEKHDHTADEQLKHRD